MQALAITSPTGHDQHTAGIIRPQTFERPKLSQATIAMTNLKSSLASVRTLMI